MLLVLNVPVPWIVSPSKMSMIGTLELSLDDWANKRKLALATLIEFLNL